MSLKHLLWLIGRFALGIAALGIVLHAVGLWWRLQQAEGEQLRGEARVLAQQIGRQLGSWRDVATIAAIGAVPAQAVRRVTGAYATLRLPPAGGSGSAAGEPFTLEPLREHLERNEDAMTVPLFATEVGRPLVAAASPTLADGARFVIVMEARELLPQAHNGTQLALAVDGRAVTDTAADGEMFGLRTSHTASQPAVVTTARAAPTPGWRLIVAREANPLGRIGEFLWPFGLAHMALLGAVLILLRRGKLAADTAIERQDRVEKRLRHSEALYRELATSDPVTGTYNRRRGHQDLDHELARHRRYGHPVSTAMLEVDGLEALKQRLEGAERDRLLRFVGRVLDASHRRTDGLYRLEHATFLLVLPETDAERTLQVVRRVQSHLATEEFETETGETLAITLSAGVAEPEDGEEERHLLSRTHKAMLDAREQGLDVCRATG